MCIGLHSGSVDTCCFYVEKY